MNLILPRKLIKRALTASQILWSRIQPRIVAFIFLSATVVALATTAGLTKWTFQPSPFALQPIAELAGPWEVCTTPSPENELCVWRAVVLPGPLPADMEFFGWAHYRRSFTTPAECQHDSCAILIGDVGQAGQVFINGQLVGEGGIVPPARAPNRLYPVTVKIPSALLKDLGHNEVKISVFAPKARGAGVTKGPLQVVGAIEAHAFARAHSLGAIFVPLAVALGLALVAGALAIYALTCPQEDGRLLWTVGAYCLANVAFLVCFADQFYEWLSMSDAVPLRYTARRMNDVALATVFWLLLDLTGVSRRLYQVALLGIWAVALGGVAYVWGHWHPSDGPLLVVAAVSRVTEATWQIKFASPIAAFLATVLGWADSRRRLQALCFATLFFVFAYDSAIFWGAKYSDYASRFHVLVLACLFSGLIVRRATERVTQTRLRYQAEAEVGRAARQVAHDIRSPLAALSHALRTTENIAEETRILMRSATGRINDIANLLLFKGREDQAAGLLPTQSNLSLLQVLELLVTERRMQYRAKLNVSIELETGDDAHCIFALVSSLEMQRALSNLVNNAVESFTDGGEVLVRLQSAENDLVHISVTDNGCGIPKHLLDGLGQRGNTFNKAGGSGLGLYHARSFAEAQGGSFTVTSEEGSGTCVLIALPQSAPPVWFTPAIEIQKGQKVVVVDDDESIHEIWRQRLAELKNAALAPTHLSTPAELKRFVSSIAPSENVLFLIDFELLGFLETGLDLIEQLSITSSAILVTSRADEIDVQQRCLELGVKLLPKALAGHVLLTLAEAYVPVDAIMLDDDPLVHAFWSLFRRERGLNILQLRRRQDLDNVLQHVAFTTPIFVDYNLAGDERGDHITAHLAAEGFTRIYLMTGEHPSELPAMPWLTGIVGKDPPNIF